MAPRDLYAMVEQTGVEQQEKSSIVADEEPSTESMWDKTKKGWSYAAEATAKSAGVVVDQAKAHPKTTAAIAGAAVAPVAFVGVLGWAGFTSTGVAAKSLAALLQGPAIEAGGFFATCQSIGAAGLGVKGTVVACSTGAAAGAGGAAVTRKSTGDDTSGNAQTSYCDECGHQSLPTEEHAEFTCSVCDDLLADENSLKRHRAKHHSSVCSECGQNRNDHHD